MEEHKLCPRIGVKIWQLIVGHPLGARPGDLSFYLVQKSLKIQGINRPAFMSHNNVRESRL